MITKPITYFGGKSYLRKEIWKIASQVSYKHRVITHAGGLGEFWEWNCNNVSEMINDIDGDLMNFYYVLKHKKLFDKFALRANLTTLSQSEWNWACKTLPTAKSSLTRALCFFIKMRMSLAGRGNSFSVASKSRTRSGINDQVSAYLGAVNGLEEVHNRLKRVIVTNVDACKLLLREDSPNTLFYMDPPYLDETRVSKKVYTCEMTPTQHEELLNTANSIQSHVMLSGYDSKLYNDLLSKWNRHEFKLPNASSHKKKKEIKTEVIWTNF